MEHGRLYAGKRFFAHKILYRFSEMKYNGRNVFLKGG